VTPAPASRAIAAAAVGLGGSAKAQTPSNTSSFSSAASTWWVFSGQGREATATARSPSWASTIEQLTSRHQSQHLRLHPVRRKKIFSRISDELRVAWMVDRFYSGDDFRQPGVMKVDVLD
jgi:hypothetical protein